ncbi:DUF58 domain-containing protein [Hahella ganghwensis]|uniref:DUF58 domain-containing protein n=1 Tax=Hahella ganghwensis TaxID=286420 RepID=UPI00038102AE|nr:DUF58 domain-containing protein [Hahella ganghwensis]
MRPHRVYTTLEELLGLRISAARLSLRFDRRKLQQLAGTHLSRFRGRGIDFSEHRQYQPGDDPRSIDWRVTARRGRVHTKVFHEEVERPVLILVDQSINLFFGSDKAFKSVAAADVASLLAWAGLNKGDRIGGVVFSDFGHQEIKPSRHPRQALRLLECVHEFNNQLKLPLDGNRQFGLNDALVELRRIARPGSQCFLISDWRQFDSTTEKLLFELKRHCQLLAFQVYDPLEASFPPGSFRLTDGINELEINTDDQALEYRFEQQFQQWQEDIVNKFAGLGMGCARISTQEDAAETLLLLQQSSRSSIASTGVAS